VEFFKLIFFFIFYWHSLFHGEQKYILYLFGFSSIRIHSSYPQILKYKTQYQSQNILSKLFYTLDPFTLFFKHFVVTNCSKERPGSIVTETLKNGILIQIVSSTESNFNADFTYISFIKISLDETNY